MVKYDEISISTIKPENPDLAKVYQPFGGRISPPVLVRSLGGPQFHLQAQRGSPNSATSSGSEAPLFRPPPLIQARPFLWQDRNMDKIMEIGNDQSLECHNLSYIRSFTTGTWYSKLFNPPITAQFLKDVSLELRAGEVMGLIGSSGSGKTTLLNVLARRVQGTTGGGILLGHRPMTERLFQKSCAYVSFRQPLLDCLSVRQTLEFQSSLGLPSAALGAGERRERVSSLLRDFELREVAGRKVGALKEAARRRLLLACHLVRDPVLILVDDPTWGLDPLSGYQLMHALFQYTKRYNRMAIVGTSEPRSDVYQLFDRLTLLFFGEVVYSGYTKRMPAYFRSLGFPCPPSENPAIFYLALATVDRETSERYLETQDTAVRLIELFKTTPAHLLAAQPPSVPPRPGPFASPLCRLGRPGTLAVLGTLIRRNYAVLWARKLDHLAARLFLLPLLAGVLTLLYWGMGGETGLESRAGLIHALLTGTSSAAAFVATTTGSFHRRRFHQERWDGLYGGGVHVAAALLSLLPLCVPSAAAAAAVLHFGLGLGTGGPLVWVGILEWLVLGAVVAAVWLFGEGLCLILLIFVKDAFTVMVSASTLMAMLAIPYSGFLKSYQTFVKTPGAPTDWLYYLSYASIYRYAGAILNYQHIANISDVCIRGSGSCRWESGPEMLGEVWLEGDLAGMEMGGRGFWLNLGLCGALAVGVNLLALLAHVLPMPHVVKRKFRYK